MARILRQYQTDLIVGAREAFMRYMRVLLVLATGGGKTVIFSEIVRGAEQKGKAATIIVHREELVTQASMSLAENGLTHRIIAPAKVIRDTMRDHINAYGKSFIHPATDVVVASVQTLVRNFDKLPDPDLIVVDEAHHATAGSWLKVLQRYPNAKVLGVTATPERLDGKGMNNVFEVLVKGISVQELIEQGFLCVPRIFSPPVNVDFAAMHTQFGDYKRDELEDAMSEGAIIGCALEHYKQICDGVPAIAFCVSVRHAEQVAEKFREAGYRAIALDGNTDKTVRKSSLAALGRGELDIVTSCDLISEGVDVPLVAAAILLRPTKSLTLYMQQVGRVLRPYPLHSPIMQLPHMQRLIGMDGTHYAFILDHAGNTLRHGLPQAHRNWTLEGKKKRGGGDRAPGLRRCPIESCSAVHAVQCRKCPECGHDYNLPLPGEPILSFGEEVGPREVAGRLMEITDTPDWAGGQSLVRTPLKTLVKLAQTEAHFRQIAAARGYKKGWVHFAMQESKAQAAGDWK